MAKKKLRSEAEILKAIALNKQKWVAGEQAKAEYRRLNKWEFFEPYVWQRSLSARIRKNNVILAPSPNGIGKTVAMLNTLHSWMVGYERWNEVDEFFPGAVRDGDKFYAPSSLGKKPPVSIRLTGQDWNSQLGGVVVAGIKEWFPLADFDIQKKGRTVECFFTHKNGSTLELMAHTQEVETYEGWRGDGWAADEPPPYNIYKPMARGLAERHGKVLLFTTPLSQAWMLDELVRGGRTGVEVLKDLTLYDNEGSFLYDSKILHELGLRGDVTPYWRKAGEEQQEFFRLITDVDDKGLAAEAFLRERCNDVEDMERKILDLIFLRKARDTDIEEKPSRFFGLFKQLMGLVIKNFDRTKHIIEAPEKIPTDMVVTVMLDVHYNKQAAISFYGCDKHNMHYAIDEYWVNATPAEIAGIIIRKKRIDGWNIEDVYIDPLSKGDNINTNLMPDLESTFTIMDDLLSDENISLTSALKDVGSGIRNIRSWLDGPNKIPILYFFDTLQSVKDGQRGVVHDIQRVSFNDDGKVDKVNDDFFENLYRYTLTGTEYVEEVSDMAFAGVGGGNEGWMGS